MQKILINLYVPALAQRFDLSVPTDLQISDLISLMVDGINNLTNERFSRSGLEVLLPESLNAVLDPERTLSDYPIMEGDRVILM